MTDNLSNYISVVQIRQDDHDNITAGTNAGETLNRENAVAGYNNILVGVNSGAVLQQGQNNVCVGHNTTTALTEGNCNVVIGIDCGVNLMDGSDNVIFGFRAGPVLADCKGSVCIGSNSSTSHDSISIGKSSFSSEKAIAIGGEEVYSGGSGSVCIGFSSKSNNEATYSISVGVSSQTFSLHCVSIGYKAVSGAEYPSIANSAIALGPYSKATQSNSIAVGCNSISNGVRSITLGESKTSGEDSCSIGHNNDTEGKYIVNIGTRNKIRGLNNINIGWDNYSEYPDCLLLGRQAKVNSAGQIGLGIKLMHPFIGQFTPTSTPSAVLTVCCGEKLYYVPLFAK